MNNSEKDLYNKTVKWIHNNLLQYDDKQIISPMLRKRIKDLAYNKDGEQLYTFPMILYTAMTHAKEIKFAFSNKDFQDDKHKINYIMVVINNDINRVKQKVLDYQREQEKASVYVEDAQKLADNKMLNGSQRYINKTENIDSERLEKLWTINH